MKRQWWHDKIAYEIYPKSFKDSNGDGIGDIQGVISKLDYLKEMGIDIIWLCPVYKSPMVDQGYDIADYYAIAEEFGTMEDIEQLISETKKRDMYLVMDLVVNHCSDQHEWFQKALQDPEGKYGDYFFFRKGKDGKAPNNLRSYFGGSVWEPVKGTDYYYLHMFAKEQPDLNWENEELKQEIYKMINWWLEKGLAGFRIDAIANIKKDLTFPDYPADLPDGSCICAMMPNSTPGLEDLLQELKANTFAKYNAFTVAELFGTKEEELGDYIGDEGCFSTMFDFFVQEMAFTGENGGLLWCEQNPLPFAAWRKGLYHSQQKVGQIGFLANILENHDEPRSASERLPEYLRNEKGKKMLAAVYMCLRGIPFLYQGQEIGMENVHRNSIEEYDDINTKGEYEAALEAGHTEAEAMKGCYRFSRDNARTPMQWNTQPHAGFTEGTPWMTENPNYKEINVQEQLERKNSLLNFYKQLIQLKKSEEWKEVLTYGKFQPLYEEKENLLCYERIQENADGEHKVVVLANFGTEAKEIGAQGGYKLLISNVEGADEFGGTLGSGEVYVLGK